MNKYLKFLSLIMIFASVITGCDKEENSNCTVGASCDDDNASTDNDIFNANCECEGTSSAIFGTITDSRDGQDYKTVTIGTQTWLAENLNYTSDNSYCYDDDNSNCTTYGRMYDWQRALTVCPDGWHLPTDVEWTVLTDYLGGESVAGGKMKSITGWPGGNQGSTNSSGFSGLPGGSRIYSGGSSGGLGAEGVWWSATDRPATETAWCRTLPSGAEWVQRSFFSTRSGSALYCRCVKD